MRIQWWFFRKFIFLESKVFLIIAYFNEAFLSTGDHCWSKSNRSQMFFKTGVLKSFAIFTGEHLCWSLFLIKMKASFLLTEVFSCGYREVFKSTYLYRTPTEATSISQDWKPFLYFGLLLQSLKSSNAS